jgi:hypothetical protein
MHAGVGGLSRVHTCRGSLAWTLAHKSSLAYARARTHAHAHTHAYAQVAPKILTWGQYGEAAVNAARRKLGAELPE